MTSSDSRQSSSPNPVLNVPAYFLYGEDWTAESFGFFHIEPLSTRNKPNQWRIGLHTHPDFEQLSVVFEGDCTFEHDGHRRHASGVHCAFTPANVVHRFEYRPGSRGCVISISPDFAESVTFGDSAVRPAMLRLAASRLIAPIHPAVARTLEHLTDLMAECAASAHPHRRETLRHLFGAFILQLDSATPTDKGMEPAAPASDDADIFQRFSECVENEIGALGLSSRAPEGPCTTEGFAARLATTPYVLNTACRKACARSAHQIIQTALLGQATRLLLYTARPIKEISYGLGYSHPSHFGRFFKRHRNVTPELFRQQHAPHIVPDEAADEPGTTIEQPPKTRKG